MAMTPPKAMGAGQAKMNTSQVPAGTGMGAPDAAHPEANPTAEAADAGSPDVEKLTKTAHGALTVLMGVAAEIAKLNPEAGAKLSGWVKDGAAIFSGQQSPEETPQGEQDAAGASPTRVMNKQPTPNSMKMPVSAMAGKGRVQPIM